jgi:hypothetical protein
MDLSYLKYHRQLKVPTCPCRWREAVMELSTLDNELRILTFKANKVVIRWKQQTVSMICEAWNAHVQEELKKRQIMERIVLRMSQRSVSQALDRWMV